MSAESKLDRLRKLHGQLDKERSSWIPHWRSLNELVTPRQPKFLLSDRNKGGKRHNRIADNTATLSLRTLSAGMMTGLTSPARPWFQLATPDKDLNEFGPVKKHLHEVSKRMRFVFARSNLYNSLPIVYSHMGLNGIAAMPIMEDVEKVIHTQVSPIGSYWLAANEKQKIDTYMREIPMTVRQVVNKFGDRHAGPFKRWNNFSTQIKSAWEAGNYETVVVVMHCTQPNPEFDPSKLLSKYKLFSSTYYEPNNNENKLLREKGFDENPIICPRWDVVGEDVYASSPGMEALGDIQELQLLNKRKSQALAKQIAPALQGPLSLANSRVSTIPNDITFVDSSNDRGGLRSIYDVKIDLGGVLNDIQDVRGRVKRAFYEDLFLMISQSDRRQVTAREIEEKGEEKLTVLGPVLGRLNYEGFDPVIDRTYSIMEQRGMLPEPPPDLEGVDLKVEYISIMAQAQKMVGLASTDRFMRYAGSLMEAVPEVADKIDFDQSIDEYADMTGVVPGIVRSDEEVAEIRENRAKKEQEQAAAEQAATAANSAKTLSETNVVDDNALTRMLGGR